MSIARLGFEPRQREPKSLVLPLHHRAGTPTIRSIPNPGPPLCPHHPHSRREPIFGAATPPVGRNRRFREYVTVAEGPPPIRVLSLFARGGQGDAIRRFPGRIGWFSVRVAAD